jgi:uncharacterized protein
VSIANNSRVDKSVSVNELQSLKACGSRPPYIQSLVHVLRRIEGRLAPVWPLQDYVAVNPYQGLADHSFLAARRKLRQLSSAEMLMPLSYYAGRFQAGSFSKSDINAAIDDLVTDRLPGVEAIDVNALLARLDACVPDASMKGDRAGAGSVIDRLDQRLGTNWAARVVEEIGKYCSDHYDQGQAAWGSRPGGRSLYQTWRTAAAHDRTLEMLGIRDFRRLVKTLPPEPVEAVAVLCGRLGIELDQCERQLWSEALALPGWCAWARYQSRMAEQRGEANDDLVAILAMRLAYTVAIADRLGIEPEVNHVCGPSSELAASQAEDELLRYVLLVASEGGYRRRLLAQMQRAGDEGVVCGEKSSERPLAQMVFCIDVRSERMRRHLEGANAGIETFGFAGFFGMPIEFVPFGEECGSAQVPVLIEPKFRVHEELLAERTCGQQSTASPADKACCHAAAALSAESSGRESSGRERTAREQAWNHYRISKQWGKAWRGFAASASSTFAFVETTGLYYGGKMVGQLAASIVARRPGATAVASGLGPGLGSLEAAGIGVQQQVDLAEGALRGIGLVDRFGKLVVLCGHGSQTENNPLQAGLDCGACGGHTGEANARFAALLLNQPDVRSGLAARGISIPEDTLFVAALHNTTTDVITFYDAEFLPETRRRDLHELQMRCTLAVEQTRLERMKLLPGSSPRDLSRRSRDWSEVRPEWGLAGNAAFIAAPRSLTKSFALNAQAFLHSYDYRLDPTFSILEQIMTAPLVVAYWINMQYYASTVDAERLGSGTKTVHNVVGQFGVVAGNGGDLMTGLPWQSIHDGDSYQHHPLRLLGVIAAPREAIKQVVERHAALDQLLVNDWLKLVAIDDGRTYRLSRDRQWDELCK